MTSHNALDNECHMLRRYDWFSAEWIDLASYGCTMKYEMIPGFKNQLPHEGTW